MIHIQVADPFSQHADLAAMESAAVVALEDRGYKDPVDISLVIDGDDELQRLNREFLGIDAPTDVLSFPADEVDPDSDNRYLGDIILSYPRAE